jgi:predicted PurR-regulated permease PerM
MFRQEPAPEVTPTPTPDAKPGTESAEKLDWAKLLKNEKVGSAAQWLGDSLAQAVKWMLGQFSAVASLFGLLAGLALVPVYGFYLLLEKDVISRKWTDYLPVTAPDVKEELVFVLSSINNYLIAFFRGQVLVALCDGLLYGVGFLLVGLPYAVVLGVLAVPLTIIPYVGSFVVFSMAMLIAVVQFGDWLHPLLVVMVFAIVQTVEGFVIQPKIVGDRVGLHPLVIIIAVITGTTLLGGLLGGILAIPLAAALRVIMVRYVWKPVDEKRTVKAGVV